MAVSRMTSPFLRPADWLADSGAWRVMAGGLVVAVTWLNPFSPGPSVGAVSCLLGAACLGLLGLWISRAEVPTIAWVGWLIAAVASATIGLLQYTGISGPFAPWVSAVSGTGEAFGNLRQPNQFATLTSIGALSLVFGAGPGTSGRWRWMAVAAAVLLAMGAAASASRTGLVQWLMLPVFWWIWRGSRSPWTWRDGLVLAAVGAYIVSAIALPWAAGSSRGLMSRLVEGAPDCSSRLVLWANVLHLVSLKPWLGWGWGELDYAHFVTLYPGERFCAILDNAHNLPLHLAVELGVPLALLACGAMAAWVWRSRPWRAKDPGHQLAWAVLAVILIHSLVEYPLWYGPFQVAVVLCLAVLLWRDSTRVAPLLARYARWGPVLWLVATGWVAWDYWCASQIYLPPQERMVNWRVDTLAKAKRVNLFTDQVDFADLTLNTLTQENAGRVYVQAERTLHFSPEARVVEKLIESAVMLRRDDEALQWLIRYRAAFPAEHAQWVESNSPWR